VTASEWERLAAPAVPIKSSVGAGDSMVAGIVLALSRGRPLGEAVRFGVAAGAAAVMNPGTALCRREDVERLYPQVMAAPR
jgi:6-phosphofructokinase 2